MKITCLNQTYQYELQDINWSNRAQNYRQKGPFVHLVETKDLSESSDLVVFPEACSWGKKLVLLLDSP